MKEISEINVAQVRIYPIDRIPFQELGAGKNPEVLRDAFQFREIQSEGRGLSFNNGLFTGPLGATVILGLSIDPRRLFLRVRGHSAQADAVHKKVWEILGAIATNRSASSIDKPLVLTQETNCVATLEIGFDELIGPTLLRFLRIDGRSMLNIDAGTVRAVDFQSLSFTVSYNSGDPLLQERGIALVNKQLVIQPRAGTSLQEKRFYTGSPTDSETHIALITKLESELLRAHHG